jgi:hypothetical protein
MDPVLVTAAVGRWHGLQDGDEGRTLWPNEMVRDIVTTIV